MTRVRNSKRAALLAASLTTIAAFGALSLTRQGPQRSNPAPVDEYPELFATQSTCPVRGDSLDNGRRAEELALLRADRYAYNPRDGVRAVEQFQTAEACYRRVGAERDTARAHRARLELSARVSTDYAAARLNLFNALQQERWSDALAECRRLLLLTEHLRRHEYVEWLKNDVGRIAARASATP